MCDSSAWAHRPPPYYGTDGCRPRAGWRFAHSFQQIAQHHRVIVFFVLGAIEQRDLLAAPRQFVELFQGVSRSRLRQFCQVALTKNCPLRGPCMEPVAQLVGGREVAQPCVQLGRRLAHAARPQPVYQYARAVSYRRLLINPFECDCHIEDGRWERNIINPFAFRERPRMDVAKVRGARIVA